MLVSQAIRRGLFRKRPKFEPEATAYFAAMTVQEPLWVKSAISACIAGIKADGNWGAVDRLFIGLGTEQASLLDMKQPAKSAVNQNGCVFTPYRGFKGNGVSAILHFNENLSLGPGFSQNSAFFNAYINQQSATTGSARILGLNGTDRVYMTVSDSGIPVGQLNGLTPQNFTGAPSGRAGQFAMVRISATATRSYRNGVFHGFSSSDASQSVNALTLRVLNGNGQYSDDRVWSAAYGSLLGNTQMIQVQQRLHTLALALGANY
jgi:hypothetical protein